MKQLTNRQILLGVTGGIAAYKSAEIIRRLQDHGADVRVVMTSAAEKFITPLTLQALSGNPIYNDLLDPAAEAAMGHIELARWADLILIAPASADAIARLANGHADDLLTTLCLASDAPLAIAPAMNQAMYRDSNTQDNIAKLAERGTAVFGPAAGAQACGDIGPGRMLEPEEIAKLAAAQFQNRALDGLNITITAGPTREAIDPVRYISNHSSGKMGYALAQAAADAGAKVTLISGPCQLSAPERVERVDVVSAADMHAASMAQMGSCDIFIGCAAVADYRPVDVAEQKIKKSNDAMQIELVKNPDIINDVAHHAQRPFTVGFAAETQDVENYARGKLERKKLDMIIANDVSVSGQGFNSNENAVKVIWREASENYGLTSKTRLAQSLIQSIAERYHASQE